MTNDGEHDASPSLDFPISTLFWKDDLGFAFRVKSNRRCEFDKRYQLLICSQNVTLSVAVGIRNPDCSAFTIQS
jgi:hypothetical protein